MAVAATCPAARRGTWSCRQQRSTSSGALVARPCLRRRQQRRPAEVWAAAGGGGGDAGGELELPKPRKPGKLEPSYWLSREEAVEAQLKALKHNNFPTIDHGIETLYRFAGFDPWDRSSYFGVSLDLGQFERFRRILYTPYYYTLLNCSSWDFTSTLEVSESVWVARVHVVNSYRKEERDYQFTMEQRFGGKYDGVWFTKALIADGCTAKTLYGVI